MKSALLIALFCVAVGVWGCSDDDNPASSAPGHVKMTLVDAPGEFDAVNIVVAEVSAHQADADNASGWIVVDNSVRTFDLLTLKNGASAILADSPLPAGHYTQIRLKLAEGSTVVVDGTTHPLTVPSGMQSGIKLNHQFDILPNTLYELTLDFDAESSIHLNGHDEYMLSPVIRVVPTVLSGSISGVISPAAAHALISTVVGTDTVKSAADTTSGAFQLMPLAAGLYTLNVASPAGGYQDTTLVDVPVIATQNTDVGTIVLHP